MKQKFIDFFNLVFGFRKLLAWLALFIVGIIFRLHGEVDGAQFVDLMKTTFMGFVAGNGVEHIMTTLKGIYDSKGQPVAAVDPDDSVVPQSAADDVKTAAVK